MASKRIYVGISPYSWGLSPVKESWAIKGYIVNSVSEALAKAKKDTYFFPYFSKIRAAGYTKVSFTWGVSRKTAYRHSTWSFDVPEYKEVMR